MNCLINSSQFNFTCINICHARERTTKDAVCGGGGGVVGAGTYGTRVLGDGKISHPFDIENN